MYVVALKIDCYLQGSFADDHSAHAFRRTFHVALLRGNIVMQMN